MCPCTSRRSCSPAPETTILFWKRTTKRQPQIFPAISAHRPRMLSPWYADTYRAVVKAANLHMWTCGSVHLLAGVLSCYQVRFDVAMIHARHTLRPERSRGCVWPRLSALWAPHTRVIDVYVPGRAVASPRGFTCRLETAVVFVWARLLNPWTRDLVTEARGLSSDTENSKQASK